MRGLTDRQNQVMQFISDYTLEHSCPPTIREMASHLNVSIRAVQDHVNALEKKGYLTKTEKQSRSIRVVNGTSSFSHTQQIPILGFVAAGKPVLCEENFEKTITLSEPFVKPGENYFALHIRGVSMINAGINDGDLAIIHQQNTARNGDIVVAVLDDTVTLKRYFKESCRIRLQPENPDYKPIFTQNVKILGKLSHIIREY